VIVVASLHEYLPLSDIVRIVAVCIGVAVLAPAAAALVITGFETQATAQEHHASRLGGDVRIALGIAVLVVLVVAGIYALAFP
jgi:hypothetical protein